MRFTSSGRCVQGKKPYYEDHYCIGSHVEEGAMSCYTYRHTDRFFPEFGLLVAVADGIGEPTAASYASQTALDLLQRQFYSERRTGAAWDDLAGCLKRYLDETQSQLLAKLSEMPGYANAGTSIAGIALMPPNLLVVFNVGDSRVLRTSGGSIRCLTVDSAPFGGGNLTQAQIGPEKAWAAGERYLLCSSSLHGGGRGLTVAEVKEALLADEDIRFLGEVIALKGYVKDPSDNCTGVAVCITEEDAESMTQ